jgi:hypothetical protein
MLPRKFNRAALWTTIISFLIGFADALPMKRNALPSEDLTRDNFDSRGSVLDPGLIGYSKFHT